MDMPKITSSYFLIPVLTLTLCPFNFFSFDSLSYCFAQSDRKLALPNNVQPGSLISKAKIYIEKNNFPLALRQLNEALKKSPRQAEAYLLRGKTMDRMGLPMKALQDLNKYIELRPQDPAGFIQRADINNFNTDHKAAVQA